MNRWQLLKNYQWTKICSLGVLISLFVIGCSNDPQSEIIADNHSVSNGISIGEAKSIEFTSLNAAIANGQTEFNFQLTDENNVAVIGLPASAVRFTLAKWQPTAYSNLSGNWQAFTNRIEVPTVGVGTEPKLQATTENATVGEWTDNGDGTYRYRFAINLTQLPADVLQQATNENLDLNYYPHLVHRIGLQLSFNNFRLNETFDFIPQTSQDEYDGVLGSEIVALQSCNQCHGELAIHGGNRTDTRYCVTCHNKGTTDANSGNSVDFKHMIHKIHMGRNLPSVIAGQPYQIYGFRNSLHDYSNLGFPNSVLNCTQCHAGNATAEQGDVITRDGDHWRDFASIQSCGSCHDDVDFSLHAGGQIDDRNCNSCHQTSGVAGAIADDHINYSQILAKQFKANILSVTNTAPGNFPVIQFSMTNPQNNDATYNILTDPEFTTASASPRLSVNIAWNSEDFNNIGNNLPNARVVSINALSSAVDLGNGVFQVTSSVAIPDGTAFPNVAASGTGAIIIEGRVAVDVGTQSVPHIIRVPLTNQHEFFTIDDASINPRREVVTIDSCNQCHGQLSMHGNNRTDSITGCVSCHNPKLTDKQTRLIAANPPTDGKLEESLDFKTLIHGIHAASIRNNPLQIVGFQGRTTHVFDQEEVHYPKPLNDCNACHVNDSQQLPLAASVLPSTQTTLVDDDPFDDLVSTAMTAVCSSCHDGAEQKAHMSNFGGSFDALVTDVSNGLIVEQCATCHGVGQSFDVLTVHQH